MRFPSKCAAGMLLGERYRITGLIGTGGMSYVYLAQDLRLPGKWWAVKESLCTAEDGKSIGDLEAEAELLSLLHHPRIARVADFYPPDEDGYTYLVMDYIEGTTLARYLELHPGPIPGKVILGYAVQLLEVLKYLHRQSPPVIYRDLKPSNIMLTGQRELVFIDFGIARAYRQGGQGDTVKLGTVGFAAPEQYEGHSLPVSDLYGLGALLLYLATGGQYCAWQPGMEAQLQSRVPDRLIPVLRRLLRQRPEERYPSAAAVLEVLAPLAEDSRPLGADIPSAPRTLQEAGAAVVALLGTAGGLGTTHTSLAAAAVLSKYGRTAWVDCTPQRDAFRSLSRLAEAPAGLAGRPGLDTLPYFTRQGVDYWSEPPGGYGELASGGYAFVVLDLGTGKAEGACAAFRSSGTPLLIASGADWRLGEALQLLRRSDLQPQPHWKVGLPLSGDHAAALLHEALGGAEVQALPAQHNPLSPKGRLAEVLEGLLGEAIAQQQPLRGVRALFSRQGRVQ